MVAVEVPKDGKIGLGYRVGAELRPLVQETRMRIEKSGKQITTLEEWPRPKSDDQWKSGRSAMEAARSWLSGVPAEVVALLSTHPDLGELTLERAEPEALIRFDSFAGPRNADLALWARTRSGAAVAITVEAKVDEPFGATVADTFADCLERLVENPRSGGVSRIFGLAQALFRTLRKPQSVVADLRYQLLTAVAGTLAHAEFIGAKQAVLVIHEFPKLGVPAKLEANAKDLGAFVARISDGAIRLEAGKLAGPITVPGQPLFENPVALYIGKATNGSV
jgi:hypothetical protein